MTLSIKPTNVCLNNVLKLSTNEKLINEIYINQETMCILYILFFAKLFLSKDAYIYRYALLVRYLDLHPPHYYNILNCDQEYSI